jgi:hypothetical protein
VLLVIEGFVALVYSSNLKLIPDKAIFLFFGVPVFALCGNKTASSPQVNSQHFPEVPPKTERSIIALLSLPYHSQLE